MDIPEKIAGDEGKPETEDNLSIVTEETASVETPEEKSGKETDASPGGADSETDSEKSDAVDDTPEADSDEKGGPDEEKIRKLEEDLSNLKKDYENRIEQSRAEIAGLKISAGIKDTAFRCGFIDPEEAVLHLKDSFNFTGEAVFFKGKRIRDAETGRFISSAVKKLAEDKPHLIRFESKPGSGAVKTETIVHPVLNPGDFSDPRVRKAYEQELKKRGITPLNPVS